MPLKDRFRKAIGRSDRSSSNSSASTDPTATNSPVPSSTPTPSNADAALPNITLTKSSSRLSKSLTWNSRKGKKDRKEQKKLEDWERYDEQEWNEPRTKFPSKKSKAHQDLLRSFEMKFKEARKSLDGRRSMSIWSGHSGVSPGTSRMNSVADQHEEGTSLNKVMTGSRRRSSGRVSSAEGPSQLGQSVGTVLEE